MSDFIHLHNHTHYSILDAIPTPKELVEAAVTDNQTAIALTDHGVMFGAIEFYKECLAKKIKPIIGCEVYIANGSRLEKDAGKTKKKNYYHLLLLAKNKIGYHNLMKLSSIGHTEGFYYRPRIDKETLKQYREGLICTSACMSGIVAFYLRANQYETAKKEAEFYKELFKDDFYIEIQNHFLPDDAIILRDAPKIAKELNIKIVATNDIHYIKKEDAIAHNVLLNIKDATGKKEIDIKKLRYGTSEFYFKTQEEMKQLFKDFPEAIEATKEIESKCDLKIIELGKLHMPNFPIPETSKDKNLDEYLTELVWKGIEEKYETITSTIKERVNYELDTIIKMKFTGYFLIVWDFIRAASQVGVSVGPGRGSAAGSIVAYALNITKIDPLKYNLLFERFLNPERVSMPDIDIDFNDETREKVIAYVKEKYGENAVAQIVTFGTLSSRAAIKDIGRVLGIELDTVNKITKQFETIAGKVESIKEGLEKESLKWTKDDERLQLLFDYAKILENTNRNTGTHAAAVVIAPGNISDYVPLYKPENSAKTQSLEFVTQYEKNCVEEAGLVKMDFLGLTTLSIIENTLKMIKDNTGENIELDNIDFDDKETFNMLSQGKTNSVFQFESNGMQEYLRQLKPQNLEELTAMNALYRPGPMQNIPNFINRKHKIEKIEYLHPIMEKTLKNTYGIIVYQEQVMQLVQDLAGFSLGEADIMRRAMGKKKKEVMDKLKPKFSEGCSKKDISKKLAEEIFDLIAEFAKYGFNKSHSLAYSYLAFQTAWLKTHYPSEYLAACMTASMLDLTKLVDIIDNTRNLNIEVLLPDINISSTNFIARDKKIFFGLAGIKNVGIPAVENLVNIRANSPFTSLFDFTSRVDTRLVNKRTLEALISTGAFDSIYGIDMRASLFASIDLSLEYAKNINDNQTQAMDNIFGESNNSIVIQEPELIKMPTWTTKERLQKEKEFLNFYISGHPLDNIYTSIVGLNSVTLNNIEEDYKTNQISSYGLVTGIIKEVKKRQDKMKNEIAFVTIENYTGTAEIAFWNNTYSLYSDILEVDNIICCQGRVIKEKDEKIKINIDEAYLIDKAVKKYFTGYSININDNEETREKLISFSEKINASMGKTNNITKIQFNLNTKNAIKKYITNNINIDIDLETINNITNLFGKRNVTMLTAIPAAPENNVRKKYQ